MSQKNISAERWTEIEALLDQALDLPQSQRTVFLQKAAENDEAIRTLLMGLWDAGKEADQFLEGDIPSEVAQAIHQLSPRKERPFVEINCVVANSTKRMGARHLANEARGVPSRARG